MAMDGASSAGLKGGIEGAGAGAAIGSLFGVPGAIIGGMIGFVAGAISGAETYHNQPKAAPEMDLETNATDNADSIKEKTETLYEFTDPTALTASGDFEAGFDTSYNENDSVAERQRKQIISDYRSESEKLDKSLYSTKGKLNYAAGVSGFKIKSATYEAQRSSINADFSEAQRDIKEKAVNMVKNMEAQTEVNYKGGMLSADNVMQAYYEKDYLNKQTEYWNNVNTATSAINTAVSFI